MSIILFVWFQHIGWLVIFFKLQYIDQYIYKLILLADTDFCSFDEFKQKKILKYNIVALFQSSQDGLCTICSIIIRQGEKERGKRQTKWDELTIIKLTN